MHGSDWEIVCGRFGARYRDKTTWSGDEQGMLCDARYSDQRAWSRRRIRRERRRTSSSPPSWTP
eukprot:1877725-Rhodomonas_salina.3